MAVRPLSNNCGSAARTGLSRGCGIQVENEMDSLHEVVGLLYVALASAAGGDKLSCDSNKLLRNAVESGAVTNPATRMMIMLLVRDCSPDALH
jgi:hypothetical protein